MKFSYVLVRNDVLSVISCPGQMDVSIQQVIVSGMTSSLAKGICGNGSISKRLSSAFDFVLIRNFLKFTGLLAENSANCFLFGGEKQTSRIPVCSVAVESQNFPFFTGETLCRYPMTSVLSFISTKRKADTSHLSLLKLKQVISVCLSVCLSVYLSLSLITDIKTSESKAIFKRNLANRQANC